MYDARWHIAIITANVGEFEVNVQKIVVFKKHEQAILMNKIRRSQLHHFPQIYFTVP